MKGDIPLYENICDLSNVLIAIDDYPILIKPIINDLKSIYPILNVAATYQTPTYQTPTYQTPTYQTPTYQTPTYQTPTYQTPAYQTSTYGSVISAADTSVNAQFPSGISNQKKFH